MCLQIVVAIFNILVNLWIIPAYSWRGAAWSSLASDGLLAVLMCIAVTVLRHRLPATVASPAPSAALDCSAD
jgi:O-antigen/teichoic acid export membrane protein